MVDAFAKGEILQVLVISLLRRVRSLARWNEHRLAERNSIQPSQDSVGIYP